MKIYSEDCINQAILSCRNLEELKTMLDSFDENDCMVLDSFDVAEDDVVAFMFPEKVPAESVQGLVNYMQTMFPENPIIGVLSDMDVLVQNADDALKMLDVMKAKITVMRGTGATTEKKIII